MSLEKITESDWSDYDNLKKKKIDANFFSCGEKWEVDYLVKKIKEHFPFIDEFRIRSAIGYCCASVEGNKPRKEFVSCVLQSLKVV
jgi:hypothetical protein